MLYQYPFSSNYFTVDSHRLHYLDEGDGPCVVLVHGNPTWSYYYRRLVSALSSTHRVIAIDHIGCGLSDKPQQYDYTLAKHINNLQALLEHLQIERYSLVVHDWGGAIGFGAAVKHPDRLERAVVLNTAAFRSQRIPFRIGLCKIPVIGEFIVRAFNGFAWPATFMAVEKKLKKEVKKAYLKPYNSWENRIATHRFVKDIPLKNDHESYQTLKEVEEGLERFQQRELPLLIGWGGKDFCFNDHFFNEWKRRFKNALVYYYPDGGHYILEDKWNEINPVITKFLKG